MKTSLKTLLLCGTVLGALTARAQITAADVENALGGGVTYLDIQPSNYTRNGVTLSTNLSSGDWGYPDSSNNSVFVGDLLDDKGESTPEIEATISGLAANTQYDLWLTLKWHDAGTGNEDDFDFSWGTSSGSLTTVVLPGSSGSPPPSGGTLVAQDNPADLSDPNNLAYQFASLTSDATGNITLYLDNGNEYVQDFSGSTDFYRTQIDGLVVSIPEPSSLVLIGIAALGALAFTRRRV